MVALVIVARVAACIIAPSTLFSVRWYFRRERSSIFYKPKPRGFLSGAAMTADSPLISLMDPPQMIIAPLFEINNAGDTLCYDGIDNNNSANNNNSNKDDVAILKSTGDTDSRDDHHDFFIDNNNITNNNNKDDDVTIEWSTGGVVTPKELKEEPPASVVDNATDTAGSGFLVFWFLVAIILVSSCPICVQFISRKAAKKHRAPLDKLIRHILPHLQRNGRNKLHDNNAQVRNYQQFSKHDLCLMLENVFGKTATTYSGKAKNELINHVMTAYSDALGTMDMQDLFTHVQGKNLNPTKEMDKDQLIRLAVEAGF